MAPAVIPVPTTGSFIGFAHETTPGVSPTSLSAYTYQPSKNFQPHDMKHYQPDENLRGSRVKNYGEIPTQGWAEYDFDGDVFIDTIGFILKGLLGDETLTGTTAPYTHAISLLNGAQPPSFSLIDYNGYVARVYPYAMFSELTVKGAADALLSYSAKCVAFPSSTTSTPTSSFSAVKPQAAYIGAVTLNSIPCVLVEDFELSLKSNAAALLAVNNSTNPSSIFAAEVEGSGKLTLIYPNDGTAETIHGYYLAGTVIPLDMLWTSGAGASTLTYQHHATSALLIDSVYKRDKNYVQLDATIEMVGNTTDAGASGGFSPSKVTLVNARSTTY